MLLVAKLRALKHRAWISRRSASAHVKHVKDLVYRKYSSLVPMRFDIDSHRTRYGELPRMYFLHREAPFSAVTDKRVPDQIFALWTGSNSMSRNRLDGLASIRRANSGREVILVTPDNLSDYVLPEAPLHPAYENLSLVHRSDYLRAYLMHYYGGGYSDIKRTSKSWDAAFRQIQTDDALWIVGYRELGSDRVGGRDAKLGHQLRVRHRQIAGAGAFICRPGTPFTAEWLREIERRLNYYEDELAEHPGDEFGQNPGYPILWIELGMDVQYPLELKYNRHVGFADEILPELQGHR